jgi:hypothetical protein
VIEKHEFPNRFLFRVSGEGAANWRVVGMKVKWKWSYEGLNPTRRFARARINSGTWSCRRNLGRKPHV